MMSEADAIAALENATREDAGGVVEQVPVTPESQTPEGESTPQVQPEPTLEDTFDGGQFNPDALPPELQEGWKSLQAAFTKKTQDLAEQRKQFETLGPLEELQAALELQNRIADPSNWGQLHRELSEAMQRYGLSPAEANAEASRQMGDTAQAQPQPTPTKLPDLDENDPELGPLVKLLKEQQARLDGFESAQVQARAKAEEERITQAVIGEMHRQDGFLRESHPLLQGLDPEKADERMDTIYDMSIAYNGNLIMAAERLNQIMVADRESYLAAKTAAAQTSGVQAPTAGAGVDSRVPTPEPESLKDAEALALGDLARLQIDTL